MYFCGDLGKNYRNAFPVIETTEKGFSARYTHSKLEKAKKREGGEIKIAIKKEKT
jgi:hypothetical protein